MLWVHCSCDSSCPTETNWNSFDCRNTITSCVHCSCDSSCFNWSPLDCSHVNCVPHVNSQMGTCAKQTLLFVITTLKVCWCDAACHLLCVHGSCDSSCFHWSLFGCSVVITTLRCVGLMLPAIRSATASVFPSIHLKLTAH